jgi:1,2-diacylglycerol 3-beta-galactosyltransferase
MSEFPLLILTSDAGYGHRSAANAIRDAFEELFGNNVNALIVNPTDIDYTPDLLAELEDGYDEMVVDSPELYRLSYHALDAPLISDVVREVVSRMYQKSLKKIIEDYCPRGIITTYPFHADSAADVLEDMKYTCPLGVVITDITDVQTLWYSKAATMHYVPTNAIRDQAIENNIPPTRIQVTGLPVNPAIFLEKRSPQEIRSTIGWEKDLQTCLVVASPRTKEMAHISQLLTHIPDLQIAVVCGGNSQLYSQLKDLEERDNFHLYDWADNMPQLMKAADFIISKAGGLIVSETLACGKPMILSDALPGQEIGNMHYIVENKAGVWAPGPLEVLTSVISMIRDDGALLRTFQENSRTLGKPLAAFDIAKSFWGVMGGD